MAAPAITPDFSRRARTCTRYSGPGAPGPAVAVIPRHSCTTSHLLRVIPGQPAAGHTACQSHPGHPACTLNQAVTGWDLRPGSHTPDISQLAWGRATSPWDWSAVLALLLAPPHGRQGHSGGERGTGRGVPCLSFIWVLRHHHRNTNTVII